MLPPTIAPKIGAVIARKLKVAIAVECETPPNLTKYSVDQY